MSKTLRLPPRCEALLRKWPEMHTVPGERPLSRDEWVVLLACTQFGFLAQLNGDAETCRECLAVIEEGSLRTRLPILYARAEPEK